MTSVWPALWPPWKRTTTSARSESQSTILPLPSSPHWAPTTTTFAIANPAVRHDEALDRSSRALKHRVIAQIRRAQAVLRVRGAEGCAAGGLAPSPLLHYRVCFHLLTPEPMPSQSLLQRFALHRLAEPTAPVAYVLLVITMLCWAGNFVIGRWASAFVPPLTLAALRWTGASLLILPLAAAHLRRDWPLVRANPKMLIFLGVMGSG